MLKNIFKNINLFVFISKKLQTCFHIVVKKNTHFMKIIIKIPTVVTVKLDVATE